MDLTYRPTTIADLGEAVPILRSRFAFSSDDIPSLLAFWRQTLTANMAESAVVEDMERPLGQRLVGFGMSVFVTDEFTLEAKREIGPFVARQVLCRWKAGNSPLLNVAQIRRTNTARELNGLILHNGWPREGRAEHQPAIRSKIMEAFLAYHTGYGLKQFLHEIYGEAERDKMLGLGWRLETDYRDFVRPEMHAEAGMDAPFLMSLRREDALNNEFHPFYSLFNAPPPRLYFRPAEQALLRYALLGASDAEAAEALCISQFTVHKRWRAIFAQVTDHDPGLLPETPEGGRGAEKRSRLLRYLHSHPEELRPVNPPPRAGKG